MDRAKKDLLEERSNENEEKRTYSELENLKNDHSISLCFCVLNQDTSNVIYDGSLFKQRVIKISLSLRIHLQEVYNMVELRSCSCARS